MRENWLVGRRRRWLPVAIAVLAAAAAISWWIRPPASLQDSGRALGDEAVRNEEAMTEGEAPAAGLTIEQDDKMTAPDASGQGGAEAPTAAAGDDIDSGEPAAALWQAVDESSVAELPAYKEFVEGRVLIRVAGVAAGWQAGQRIAIPVPQLNEVYTPVIERVEPGPTGIRSFVGTLTEEDNRGYRFTITTGPRNTFANLSTPLGGFELVATGEYGWLMPTANMDQHVDYSVPDFLIPDPPVSLER